MSELSKKTEKDLLKALGEKRDALRGFKLGMSGSKTRNVKEGHALKKDIAKILTELNARKAVASK